MSAEQTEVSIDDWRPSIPKSDWRKAQVDNKYFNEPGIDDLKKIRVYIKNKVADWEIMQTFGIDCETLFAIKVDCYDPAEGILPSFKTIVRMAKRNKRDALKGY